MDYKKIGLKIKKLRKQLGMTQQQLADSIGRVESSIRKYEKGEVEIPNSVLSSIASALDINVAYFYSDVNNPEDLEEIKQEFTADQLIIYVNKLIEMGFKCIEENEQGSILTDGKAFITLPIEGLLNSTKEFQLISNFNELNETGKDEAIKRIKELTFIDIYKK